MCRNSGGRVESRVRGKGTNSQEKTLSEVTDRHLSSRAVKLLHGRSETACKVLYHWVVVEILFSMVGRTQAVT